MIEMFNMSLNAQRGGLQYPQRSLANRRLAAVIRDVAELVMQGDKPVQPTRAAEPTEWRDASRCGPRG